LDGLGNYFDTGKKELLKKPVQTDELLLKVDCLVGGSGSRNLAFRDKEESEFFAELTKKEYQIYQAINGGLNKTATRASIVSAVWGDVRVGKKTLDVHLFNLRRKLSTKGLEVRFIEPGSFHLVKSGNNQAKPDTLEMAAI